MHENPALCFPVVLLISDSISVLAGDSAGMGVEEAGPIYGSGVRNIVLMTGFESFNLELYNRVRSWLYISSYYW